MKQLSHVRFEICTVVLGGSDRLGRVTVLQPKCFELL